MKVKAVIFDLDGTLTEPLLDFNRIRQEMGLSPEAHDILEAMKQMSSDKRRQADDILFRHEQHAAEHSSLNDGVHDVFLKLRQMDLPIGLLTRNTLENVEVVARKHNLHFDAVIDRQTKPAKPDGFGVRKLCEQFNAEPAQTLVVGDFLHDLLAARDAGAIAVLIKTHQKAEEFEQYADYSIVHLDEIFDIIRMVENN